MKMKNKGDSPETDKTLIKSTNQFPVAGIGASAGGLEAFKRLIKAIPENSGMAFVLVQHLHPGHESFLPELLQKVTNVPVLEITDDIKVLPDHIYIIPSNKILIANDGVLELSPRPDKSKNILNLPIDLFFESLAEIHHKHAVGVVLSGTASDGTKGLKAIKENGGVTFAQDSSAAYDAMPQNAINAGVVDFILSPEAIIQKLIDLKETGNFNKDEEEEEEELADLSASENNSFKKIIAQLRERKGTDFTCYKQTTVRRRIIHRMAITEKEDLAGYVSLLLGSPTEQDALFQDMLIPVTSFFRDQKVFGDLPVSVFPIMTKSKPAGEPLRAWVAGCSTGQEAYSIAICFKEFLGDNVGSLQIFATDISEPAIKKARLGIYSDIEVKGISETRLNEFFTPKGKNFQINKQIRDMCIFAPHNFLKDPLFGKMDLVSCRNVLIYFETSLQKKALTNFHYALNPKGFLLLGKSETNSSLPDHFAPTAKGGKLFIRNQGPPRTILTAKSDQQQRTFPDPLLKKEIVRKDFQQQADAILLSQYTPAGVVVNEAMDIVDFHGNTASFLGQASGKPSHNLFAMAKEGLAFELRSLLLKVKNDGGTVVKENIPLLIEGSGRIISVEASLLPDTSEPHYLIVFLEIPLNENSLVKPSGKKSKAQAFQIASEKDQRIKMLENELVRVREDMRSITEDQEGANEELQSANEELLSSSEELQSLNEELETSQEELTSSIEELTSMNQEIVNLNEQSAAALEYAEAIITTLPEPLLVLDKNLRIKTANDSFYKTFGVSSKDTEGILIYDVGNKQWDIPVLRTLLEEILPQKTRISDFEVQHVFPMIGERIMLLNASEVLRHVDDDKLILLAIRDVTERSQHHYKEKELLNRFRNLVLEAPVAICVLTGSNHKVELANDFYLKIVGRGNEFLGKPILESLPELIPQGIKELLDGVYQTGIPFYGNEVEIHMLRNNENQQCYFNFTYQPVSEENLEVTGVIVVVTEVTDQVIARKKMEAQAIMVEELLMTAPGFVATLSGPDHVYELVNERYQDLFGKRKIQGKPILIALPELEGQGFDIILDEVYTTGKPYLGIDIPVTLGRDEGLVPELRYFNFSYQPMYDENKNIFSILVFGYEVTEQVLAKNRIIEIQHNQTVMLEEKVLQRTIELNNSNSVLQQKNEELSSFNFISSHDLQEPLRKIRTFSNLLVENDKTTLSAKGKEYLDRINKSAARMQTLIEDLLVYSRTDVKERIFEKINLSVILENVKKDLFETIEERKAVILCKGLCEVRVNTFQFNQVLNNLISNCLKFSDPGRSPEIIIKSMKRKGIKFQEKRLHPETEYCHISVEDNGIGFSSQYKDLIFGVFQRLSTKEEYPGTGIGLAIVKKIVENHNGFITADGEPGKGATFNIYIPVD